mmetsp:Transcript_2099/g.5302  ORF Transcript_2099/g.5302 Transcript_2099/m.5302 type:complete len:234 (-) Transcript_2099:723-1424(-)
MQQVDYRCGRLPRGGTAARALSSSQAWDGVGLRGGGNERAAREGRRQLRGDERLQGRQRPGGVHHLPVRLPRALQQLVVEQRLVSARHAVHASGAVPQVHRQPGLRGCEVRLGRLLQLLHLLHAPLHLLPRLPRRGVHLPRGAQHPAHRQHVVHAPAVQRRARLAARPQAALEDDARMPDLVEVHRQLGELEVPVRVVRAQLDHVGVVLQRLDHAHLLLVAFAEDAEHLSGHA